MTVRFSVRPARPYALALTASRYARFPEVVDLFDGKTYRRLLLPGREAALLSVSQRGGPDRAVLEVVLGAGRGRARRRAARAGWSSARSAPPPTSRRSSRVLRGPAARGVDPGLPGSAYRRVSLAVGGARDRDPLPAGQPALRVRHPPRARARFGAPRAHRRCVSRGLPLAGVRGGGSPLRSCAGSASRATRPPRSGASPAPSRRGRWRRARSPPCRTTPPSRRSPPSAAWGGGRPKSRCCAGSGRTDDLPGR